MAIRRIKPKDLDPRERAQKEKERLQKKKKELDKLAKRLTPKEKDVLKAFESVGSSKEKAQAAAQDYADQRAKEYVAARGEDAEFNDCVTVVAAACSAAAGYLGSTGGVYGAIGAAALGAGGGVVCGRIACRKMVK